MKSIRGQRRDGVEWQVQKLQIISIRKDIWNTQLHIPLDQLILNEKLFCNANY